MTDEQWKDAAREYCRLMGVDPDEQVPDPFNTSMAYYTCNRWHAVVVQLKQHAAMSDAIEFGRTIGCS